MHVSVCVCVCMCVLCACALVYLYMFFLSYKGLQGNTKKRIHILYHQRLSQCAIDLFNAVSFCNVFSCND